MEGNSFLEFGSTVFDGGLAVFVVETALIVVVLTLFKNMIIASLKKAAERRGTSSADTTLRFICGFVNAVINVLMAFLILRNIIPMRSVMNTLLGATSVLALVYGIAAQEAFGNLVAGFFLAIYQPFRIGDLITLPSDNISGTVKEITLRHTIVSTYDGTNIIVPNAKMNSAIVEDKHIESGFFSRLIVISVSYDTDIDFAKKVINDAVTSLPEFIDTRSAEDIAAGLPAVNVVLTEFLDSGIELSFRVSTASAAMAYPFAGKVREAVLKAFRENDIVIPYPTCTIEMQS